MKKILFISAVSAVLIGLAQTSQAGVRFGVGFGLSFPTVVVAQPAPVVVQAAPVCVPAPVIVAAPCAPAPVVVVREPAFYPGYRHVYYARGWDHRGFRR